MPRLLRTVARTAVIAGTATSAAAMLQRLDQHPCHLAVAGDNGMIGRLQRRVEGNSHRAILSSQSLRKSIFDA